MPRKKPTPKSIEVSKPEPPLDIEAFLAGASNAGSDDAGRDNSPDPAGNAGDPQSPGVEDLGDDMPLGEPQIAPPAGVPGPILTRYESRIQIIDAYQYHGSVADAPAWVDRNWIGYCDDDPVREIPAGPCLRVPIAGAGESGDVVLCRNGDYIAQQSVQLSLGELPIIRIEVWNRDMFHKLFLGRDISVKPDHPEGYQAVRSSQLTIPEEGDVAQASDESASR